MKKRTILTLFITILLCSGLTGCGHTHEWQDATCTEPKTCAVCDKTEGEALGHTWQEATCTTPKTCTVCGKTKGETSGHTWQEATCAAPKTCTVCGETEGTALEHTWQEATCTTPKTCTVCGETEGTPVEHNINYNTGKCYTCDRQIIDIKKISVSDIDSYFNVTYTSTATSPCTITVEPKDSGYTYNGSISLKIYTGKKKSYGQKTAEYANTYYDSASIELDEKGCGSVKISFPDYGYHIRYEITTCSVTRYKK